MAKKPAKKKAPKPKESKLKAMIRKFISKEGDLKAELHDPKLEFGFHFFHPKGKTPTGQPKGRSFQVNKPKKENLLDFSVSTTISPQHIKFLESKGIKDDFFNNLGKFLRLKNVGYKLDRKNNRYNIFKRIYFENDYLSMNIFYETIQRLLNLDIYIVIIIQEICTGKIGPEDVSGGPQYFT